jgi:hypothetical protein
MAHDRTLDHYGTEDTTTAVLSDAIGRYPAGTSLQDVLADMVSRLIQLENDPQLFTFTADAQLKGYWFSADAWFFKTLGNAPGEYLDFRADAEIGGTHYGAFTASAIKGTTSGASATGSFTASSLLINHVPGSGSGTLVDPIDDDDTTVNVSNPGSFPPTFPFVITIDGEQVLVVGGVPGAWIIERGYGGTTPTSHSGGATVTETC